VQPKKQRLRQEILLLVVLKLIAISALWWYFVRDARITVNPVSAAEHLGSPVRNLALPGENHDQ